MAEAGICGVLLAAGRSLRFGGDKLLAPLPDGTPVALASARAMRAALPRVVAVVRADAVALRDLLAAAGIDTVAAPADGEGLGRSLAAGVAATPDASGWIVGLADMPFVSPRTIEAVRAALADGAGLAAPVHQGRRGHPVGFARRHFDALAALQGDAGARGLLEAHCNELALIECDDAGSIRDIDRPEDLPE